MFWFNKKKREEEQEKEKKIKREWEQAREKENQERKEKEEKRQKELWKQLKTEYDDIVEKYPLGKKYFYNNLKVMVVNHKIVNGNMYDGRLDWAKVVLTVQWFDVNLHITSIDIEYDKLNIFLKTKEEK